MVPSVSIIMAAYNAEKYISQAIESILNQNFADFELLVINDGSTDQTQEIVENYIKKDLRVILINNKRNLFVIKSRNIGIQKAKGKYIAILDSDDIALPDKLEKQVDFLEKNPDIFLVGSTIDKIDAENNVIGVTDISGVVDPEKYKKDNFIYHSTILFRNDITVHYREKMIFSEDYDFLLRLLSDRKKLFILNERLVKYRFLDSSLSHTNNGIIPWLFFDKTRRFYEERCKTGKDSYVLFEPDEFRKINEWEYKNQKETLLLALKFSFYKSDFEKMKLYLKKYRRFYPMSKVTLFYSFILIDKNFFNLTKYIYSKI